MVIVREARPGKAFPQPRTLEEKITRAQRLRDLHRFEFEVALDDVDGTLHRVLSPKPNSAYILGDDGTILFRAHWANDTEALAAALDAVAEGEAPPRAQSGGLVGPVLRMIRNIAPASTGRAATPGPTCGVSRPRWQPSPSGSRPFASARAGADHT